MGIVFQKDKRSGITYAYENQAYWDKVKKQSRSKRELVGRVNPVTGEIVPTDGRNRKAMKKKEEGGHPDYKLLYEKLLKKHVLLETLNAALQKDLKRLKGRGTGD